MFASEPAPDKSRQFDRIAGQVRHGADDLAGGVEHADGEI
jgi:hypothetical protein